MLDVLAIEKRAGPCVDQRPPVTGAPVDDQLRPCRDHDPRSERKIDQPGRHPPGDFRSACIDLERDSAAGPLSDLRTRSTAGDSQASESGLERFEGTDTALPRDAFIINIRDQAADRPHQAPFPVEDGAQFTLKDRHTSHDLLETDHLHAGPPAEALAPLLQPVDVIVAQAVELSMLAQKPAGDLRHRGGRVGRFQAPP
jgi:hypothetical protein